MTHSPDDTLLILLTLTHLAAATAGLILAPRLDRRDAERTERELRDRIAELETQNRILSETLDRVEERQRLEQWHLMRH